MRIRGCRCTRYDRTFLRENTALGALTFRRFATGDSRIRTTLLVALPYPHGYPHTCPRGGDILLRSERPLVQRFCRGSAASRHPRLRSVLWLARRVDWGGSRARQKPPSSLTRNEYERVHRRTGWTGLTTKGQCPLRVKPVKTGGRV
jgi:hypothetical protein